MPTLVRIIARLSRLGLAQTDRTSEVLGAALRVIHSAFVQLWRPRMARTTLGNHSAQFATPAKDIYRCIDNRPAGGVLLKRVVIFLIPVAAVIAAGGSGRAQNADLSRHIVPAFNRQLDVVAPPTGFGSGRIWRVGPKHTFKKPSDVVGRVRDGDIVEIHAARYACDTGLKWSANYLTLVGVGGRPVLDATDCGGVVGDKGIWNPGGEGLIVDNIEFVGASGPSHNDAGIRYDGKGYLYITNSYFHDNENGILVTAVKAASTDIVIDRSEFAHNGTGDGRTHNIYISSSEPTMVHSFVIRFSYSHQANIGHEVKTRAQTNYILYNRLADEADGTSSYDIDISQGGLTYIIGNIIQHGAHADNAAMVSYAAETPSNAVQELYIINNTFVSEVTGSPVAVNLDDHGLSVAKMTNNLVVGIPERQVVGVSPAKMLIRNNVVTAEPAFYDRAHREYHLTANSPAVRAGTDPDSVHSISLVPAYEFTYPASAVPRPHAGVLDVGGYQYIAGQVIPPPPDVTFTAKSPVDYDSSVTLSWSVRGATYCTATGDWSGALASSGIYRSPSATSRKTYGISCEGPGGSASQSAAVEVNQSPAAAALGTYEWREIPNSALISVCASAIEDSGGRFVYEDDFGTGPYCEGKDIGATGVYVPPTHTWYLIGGAGGRNYYGNEVYGFNLATQKPELVTLPDHISASKEYVPADAENSKLHLPGCDRILHMQQDGIAPAAHAVFGTAAWNPQLKEIIVGPGTFLKGAGDCSPRVNGEVEFGQMTTDIWGFAPPEDAQLPAGSAQTWHLLAGGNNAFGSVSVPLWLFDPVSGLIYVGGNRAYPDRGGFLIDPSHRRAKVALANAIWPYGGDVVGASAVDTDHHYAMVIGNGAMAMWNLNGLSLTKYGAHAPFIHESGWTIIGDKELFKNPHRPGITYNPKLKAFVAWTGSTTIYFLYPNYTSKTISVVAKMDVAAGPSDRANDLDGKFTYIPESDAYLAFTGMRQNFSLLIPPRPIPPK